MNSLSAMRIELLQDAGAWRAALRAFPGHDFAHTWSFGQAEKSRGVGEPTVVDIQDGDRRLVLRFLWGETGHGCSPARRLRGQ